VFSDCADAGYTALYTAYVTSIPLLHAGYRFRPRPVLAAMQEDKKKNPRNYALVVFGIGGSGRLQGSSTARRNPMGQNIRKKASVGESLSERDQKARSCGV